MASLLDDIDWRSIQNMASDEELVNSWRPAGAPMAGGAVQPNAPQPPRALPSQAQAQAQPSMGAKPQRRSLGQFVGNLGDILAAMGGRQGLYQSEMDRRDKLRRKEAGEAALAKWIANPQDRAAFADYARFDAKGAFDFQESMDKRDEPMKVGDSLVRRNRETGDYDQVYRAPEDFEHYAEVLGYEPGSDEFLRAAQDYVLRASGPTATDNDLEIEGARQGNREALENARHRNRLGLEGVRQQGRRDLRSRPTYRDMHPAPPRTRSRTSPRSSGSSSGSTAPTIRNPKTGETMVLRGGKWVPAQ